MFIPFFIHSCIYLARTPSPSAEMSLTSALAFKWSACHLSFTSNPLFLLPPSSLSSSPELAALFAAGLRCIKYEMTAKLAAEWNVPSGRPNKWGKKKKISIGFLSAFEIQHLSFRQPLIHSYTLFQIIRHHRVCLSDGNIPHSCSDWNGMCVCGWSGMHH